MWCRHTAQLQGHRLSQFSSVQFSRSVVSDSLWLHELQHARPPWPPPTPRVYSNPCPSSRWFHPAISSSAIPFSSCPQSLLASGSFPKSQLFTWGDQSIGISASASVLPMNTQDWSPFRMGWLDSPWGTIYRVFILHEWRPLDLWDVAAPLLGSETDLTGWNASPSLYLSPLPQKVQGHGSDNPDSN